MPFERPITIEQALKNIQNRKFVLPAIQRDFVWDDEQICRLFDSLMRGYPIGSFLFWKIEPEDCQKYGFYEFIRDYHERDCNKCRPLDVDDPQGVTAILDGQQRLTSLYVGLKGSYADKLPRKHRTSPDAYPTRKLYLNIAKTAPENDLGVEYDFQFLTPERATALSVEGNHYFEVGKILTMPDAGPSMHKYLVGIKQGDNTDAFSRLSRLYDMVKKDDSVNYYAETQADPDKVLNIFVRVNSGGTPLSYSDLLLSIATAKWNGQDDEGARETIHSLVRDLNNVGRGFAFDKDFVLKAALYLSDILNIKFKVTNFNVQNMKLLEDNWKTIRATLLLAARLLSEFGLQADNLSANSVALPLAYFLMKRGATESFVTATGFKDEREEIRSWVFRSLLKRGIWGSGLDTLLTALRDVFRAKAQSKFPVAELEAAMLAKGKSLRFDTEEIREVLSDTRYGDQRTFVTLALLFPHVDLRNQFHVDHVFPRAQFRRDRLRKAGVPEDQVEPFVSMVDGLPNLQLLAGSENIQKQDTLPAKWLESAFTDVPSRTHYCSLNELGTVPASVVDFSTFFEDRRARLETKLAKLLGVASP